MKEFDIQKMLEITSKKLGTTPDKLKSALEKGEVNKLAANLNPRDKAKMKEVLKNPAIAKEVKKSDKMQKIIEDLDKK